jgi:hypothetical protein
VLHLRGPSNNPWSRRCILARIIFQTTTLPRLRSRLHRPPETDDKRDDIQTQTVAFPVAQDWNWEEVEQTTTQERIRQNVYLGILVRPRTKSDRDLSRDAKSQSLVEWETETTRPEK